MENNISEKAFAKITEEGIQPAPEYRFRVKRALFWISAGFSIVVGAVATAVSVYVLTDNDWDLYKTLGFAQTKGIWALTVIQSLPYIWAVIFLIFFFSAYYNFRHTKFGYRYKLWQVVLANLILAIIFGGIFYCLGMGERIDYCLAKAMPLYREFNNPRLKIWDNHNPNVPNLPKPEMRFIAGEIKNAEASILWVEDINERLWKININKAFIRPRVVLDNGRLVRIIGKEIKEEFFAEEIFPWGMRIELKETFFPQRIK